MKLLLLALALVAASFAAAQTPVPESAKAEPSKDKLWFMFFVKSDGPRPAEAAKLEDMQKGHLANMSRLFGEGKLWLAGPIQDPTQIRRGVTVLVAPDRATIDTFFLEDPFVQAKILAVEAREWVGDAAGINHKDPDPNGLSENRIVVLSGKDGKAPSRKFANAHLGHLSNLRAVKLSAHGVLAGTPYREVLLFVGTDEDAIKAELARDPLIQFGLATYEIMPLWVAKNALLVPKTDRPYAG